MRRLLMVSPHFPPDSSAGSHRVRLLAPYLPDFGWQPTVLSVDSRDYEGRLDPDLLALVPESLRVIRARALSSRWTRLVRVGDLGLRAFPSLLQSARRLLREENFDCLFVTIYPTYTALLGPLLKRRSSIRFVLDYQDPWVGSWGKTSGPGPDGAPDFKSRLSRFVAEHLEPRAVRAADAITAVSEETYDAVRRRIPKAQTLPCVEIPLGGEPRDFELVRRRPRHHPYFAPSDGHFHISYVGTLLPMGFETLDCFLDALLRLKQEEPPLFAKVRVHFLGTSNQFAHDASERVLPRARDRGLEEAIQEIPARVDYLQALTILTQSSAILLLGSSEKHYTASKIYPALLARKPLLAAYHEESSVVSILRGMGSPSIRLVTYSEERPASSQRDAMYQELLGLLKQTKDAADTDRPTLEEYSARSMARRLGELLDSMVEPN